MPNPSSLKVAKPLITIAGQDMPGIAQELEDLLIMENASGLYRCEAVFNNWGPSNGNVGFLFFDRRTLDFGKSFQVKLGSETIFDGRIMGMEAHFPEGSPAALNILAEDRFQDLRMTRRTRTFVDVSDADVINQVANEYGLTPKVDVTGPKYKVLAQINQSDLAFLRERARSIDAELWMDGKTLNAQARTKRNGGTARLTYRRELREFSVLADLAQQRTSVMVNGWDVASKSGIQYEATESIIKGELNGDTSGTNILSSAFGERKEALAHTVPLSSSEAQTEAETFFKMSARRFITGRGIAEADSKLRVGSFVELLSLGPLFSGKYYLSEVKFLFDIAHGIRVEFTAERPGMGQAQ